MPTELGSSEKAPCCGRNGSALIFDLATAMLLEYLLERFFEAGEGAKAV